MAWFKENSSLYEEEIHQLNKNNYKFEIDESEKKLGNLVIYVDYEIDNKTFKLKCEYPPSYPFFAVKVSCKEFPSGRHICPVSFGICLFFDEQSSWSPSDSLASIIRKRIRIIYDAHLSPDTISEHETEEGYQVSGQLRYEDFSTIFMEDVNFSSSDSYGNMTLSVSEDVSIDSSIKGSIKDISLISGVQTVSSTKIEGRYKKSINARWVKLDEPLSKFEASELLEIAIQINPSIKKPLVNKLGKHKIDIVAIAFPEEKLGREKSINWLFISRRSKKLGTNKNIPAITLIRSDYYTRDNLTIRTPRLEGLKEKSVLLIGIGALGSHVAMQLARTGIQNLTVVDCDYLQAGNLPRWIPAFDHIGHYKAFAIQQILLRNYPFLNCLPIHLRIGQTGKVQYFEKTSNSHDIVLDLIDKSDLVIDCTAESNVSHYLSNLCSFKRKDFVWATATTGGWGGIVGNTSPAKGNASWFKFSKQYFDGKIEKPASEDVPMVQSTGCFSPTFTGAGFDLDQVSLMTTRLSVSLLLKDKDKKSAYTGFEWDVAVLNLWDEKNITPIAPEWITYNV